MWEYLQLAWWREISFLALTNLTGLHCVLYHCSMIFKWLMNGQLKPENVDEGNSNLLLAKI